MSISENDSNDDQLDPSTPQKPAENDPSNELAKLDELEDEVDPELIRELKTLPKEQAARFVAIIERTIKSHQGPLPDPDTLARYDSIIPNGAERIMQMAEKEGDHRRSIDKAVIDKSFSIKFRGQIFGFLIALTTMAIGGWSIHEGHEISGSIFGIGGVATLAAVFVTGRLGKKSDDSEND
ncbi:DUF2335 domain-containing protein [Dyadobacter jiangsuensis]